VSERIHHHSAIAALAICGLILLYLVWRKVGGKKN
jgi:hypothetical protein